MKRFYSLVLFSLAILVMSSPAMARDHFKICWSIYVGWMPWGYAADEASSANGPTNTVSPLMSCKLTITSSPSINTPSANLTPAP
ncbi:ABC transporter periplasmic binding protein, urea carboxylase region [Nitrincola nitratireducens]|uniref:ABC transporter periplasmic binding protein, urea carboxylase region n=1 Tax=Nitrincola nitratireducens TaxID=1229521 RepID=W9UVK3_9GAMM|nr:ABC transporter periplasmic binding protein, urea carboxylase region [Nitrincola nitratireducens]